MVALRTYGYFLNILHDPQVPSQIPHQSKCAESSSQKLTVFWGYIWSKKCPFQSCLSPPMKRCESVKYVHTIQKRVTFSQKVSPMPSICFSRGAGFGKKNAQKWSFLDPGIHPRSVLPGQCEKKLLKPIFFKSDRGGTKRVTFSRKMSWAGLLGDDPVTPKFCTFLGPGKSLGKVNFLLECKIVGL